MVEEDIEQLRQEISLALDAEDNTELSRLLAGVGIAETARLLDSLPSQQRDAIWPLLAPEELGAVLLETQDDVSNARLRQLEPEEIAAIVETMPDVDDQADIILALPTDKLARTLHTLDAHKRERLNAVLSYSEDTAGGLMNIDQVTIRADVSLDVVLRYLRMRGDLPDQTDQLFVTDRHDHFLGALYLRDLLTNDPDVRVSDIMRTDIDAMHAHMSDTEVAREFENYDLVSAPVVDEEHKLIGRITVDDVVDVIHEEHEEDIMRLGGVGGEDDFYSAIFTTARGRAVWLAVHLCAVLVGSAVIGLFRASIEEMVALAILMPIVAALGGTAGIQTLTVTVRAIAMRELASGNALRLIGKEVLVGGFNGLLFAVVVGAIAWTWFGDPMLGVVIGLAMISNLLIAGLAGSALPFILVRVGIDPAIASSPFLISLTDVMGFYVFLGLATLILL